MRICDLLASSSDELKNIADKNLKIINQTHDQDPFRPPSLKGYQNKAVTYDLASSEPFSTPVVVTAYHSSSYSYKDSPNDISDDERYKARKWMPIPIPPVQARKKRNLISFETRSRGINGSKVVHRRVRAESSSSEDSRTLHSSKNRRVRISSRSV